MINVNLNKEKKQIDINFHRRRAAYDLILANASAVYGRFSGISGSEIQDIDTINQNEKELKSNVELLRGIGNI